VRNKGFHPPAARCFPPVAPCLIVFYRFDPESTLARNAKWRNRLGFFSLVSAKARQPSALQTVIAFSWAILCYACPQPLLMPRRGIRRFM
jgi:hypothetical protein